ncbi:RNA polymerase II transcription factor B subunit 2, putative [Plasmodium chabaudi chabaudi]|uniref:General transcription factor IIH subunit 4 n=1 Tax=Plasmodium chabaudi chabaudi TaxID=31271 RepID=A0A1D3S550_PLACU|nr:RNA polymerase II transcription factor B subunit 2, putative [Plasmodium chabaudi chabaudi]
MVKARKNIENMEIYDYMKEMDAKIWEYLFDDSLAHETIFNSLNELEQIIISRLLFIQQVVSERAMRLWINPNFLKKLSESIKNLVDVKILVESETKKDNYNQYKINDRFRLTLLNKIYQNDKSNIFIFNNNIKLQLNKEKELYEKKLFPTKEGILCYASARWNTLLHFIASPNLNSYKYSHSYSGSYASTYPHSSSIHGGIDSPIKTEMGTSIDPNNVHSYGGEYSYNNSLKSVKVEKGNYYGTQTKKSRKNNEDSDEEYQPYGDEMYDDENYENESFSQRRKYKSYGEYENTGNDSEYDEDEGYEDESNEQYDNQTRNKYSQNYNDIENSNSGKYLNPRMGNKENINLYDPNKKRDGRRGRKKKKGVYAYKQNNLYYKSLQSRENNNMEEENNDFFFSSSNIKKEDLLTCAPCGSLIEVLKKKKFILDDVNNSSNIANNNNNNKTINMSREAFSWFLKDIRSRIISLVIEYLLIIDDGNVTNIAKQNSAKHKKKGNSENVISNDGNEALPNSSISNTLINDYNNNDNMNNNNVNGGEWGTNNEDMNNADGLNMNIKDAQDYITDPNKNSQKSEIYIKETLLFILSLTQCNIGQPIFLENLTKAQKEFVDFGIHIGLFLKTHDSYIFITPYALLLTINNLNVENYISILNHLSVEKFCEESGYNNNEDENIKKKAKLSEIYFHKYLLIQNTVRVKSEPLMDEDEKKDMKKFETKNYISQDITNHNIHSEKRLNENDNLEIGLIIQSNFKVYLYTSSILKINILSHLCELQARTPNMVVGILTRRSVLNAYNSDITADQIIKFLESYSHPGKTKLKSIIPINVITQLKLWEAERHRLTLEDSIVFKNFEKEYLPHLYQQIVIWANSKNYLLHYTPWPKNTNSPEFDAWMKTEKYLCCIYESKNEIIDKIKEIRGKLMKKRQAI